MSTRFLGNTSTFISMAVLAILSASGCTEADEGRRYPVPNSLCGMDIDTDLIEPFLPPGDQIHQTEDGAGTIIRSCNVSVDGEDVFQVSQERWEEGWTIRRFAVMHAYVDPDHEAADNSYIYSAEGALSAIRCTDQGGDRDLFLVARVRNSGVPDEEAMMKFITAYRAEVLKTTPCAEE